MQCSVIVPVGPSENLHHQLLAQLVQAPAIAEILVVKELADGRDELQHPKVKILRSERGRAKQLNAGAHAAQAGFLWFVHADSIPSQTAFERLQDLTNERTIYYFDIRFYDGPAPLWLNAWGAWLRSRVMKLPFGDQGLALKSELFRELGGFPDVDIGEDLSFVYRARAHGIHIQPLNATLATSGRSYTSHWIATTVRRLVLTWQLVLAERSIETTRHHSTASHTE